MKSTWSIIKTVTRSKVDVNIISLIHVNDNLTNNNQIKVNAFDKYFLTVAENISVENLNDKNSVLNNTCIMYSSNCFQILNWNTQPQMKLKKMLNLWKWKILKYTMGYRQIILKFSMSYSSSPLTFIWNTMLSTGTFPTRSKFSEIQPLLIIIIIIKKKKQNGVKLQILLKIFEIIMYMRSYNHINGNHILVHEPFGFKNNSAA